MNTDLCACVDFFKVSWSLPGTDVMSENCRDSCISLQLMSRAELETYIGTPFSEELSAYQMTELDTFLDEQEDNEQGKENDEAINPEIKPESVSPSLTPSLLLDSHTKPRIQSKSLRIIICSCHRR